MPKLNRIVLSLSIFLFVGILQAAAIDVNKLIKVTKENNPKCIIYYYYKNELYCSTSALSSGKPDPQIVNYETQAIIFDDRPWQAAWGQKTDTITTVEYVPAGENVENWNELITSQFISGLKDKITPLQFSERVIQSLQQLGFKPEITFFEKSPNRVIFEFRITEPQNVMQDELQMITKGQNGLYILHYVIKTSNMGEDNRRKWLKNLQASKPIESQ
ncbi:Uncharacterised protein [Legionella lansingensis]|uniref:Uncharacterized protein n=1 Tax=Legionella lansingensis TaxID=45067 RepID=A0A0W0VF30_9GAMM|nr:hypothetical protein [Legionella lansingensis]KTD18493.1 hypothetical protein Llan_2543 [Legionella lansingensis]SNV50116.1 Uncharacterised protein [Legionella lansingensis]